MDQLLVRKLREQHSLEPRKMRQGPSPDISPETEKQIGSEHPVALNPDHDRMSNLSVHKLNKRVLIYGRA